VKGRIVVWIAAKTYQDAYRAMDEFIELGSFDRLVLAH